ncbi:hypothetical protein SAMN05444007_108263 [Cribrihabitans marinus]|uniref:Uncharacterized protein n=1 Tax=Cribrihabitans marinus TaxID=1227549 RepID=A0A1H7CQH7_9RHOB|nr:hypothetical protein [Cribrihabitans marinus]GGH36433.1 hypothetical protein GCM10010973_30350 [Cribrihabitans marinus]SEJ91928.1 hypothetical protein SAMN05444007_108263 [Cribrihabitans marinus]
MPQDPFRHHVPGLSDPGRHAAAVTPNDTVDLDPPARSLFIGTGGNVRVLTYGSETVDFKGVQTGHVLPMHVRRVLASGTTAADIVAIW